MGTILALAPVDFTGIPFRSGRSHYFWNDRSWASRNGLQGHSVSKWKKPLFLGSSKLGFEKYLCIRSVREASYLDCISCCGQNRMIQGILLIDATNSRCTIEPLEVFGSLPLTHSLVSLNVALCSFSLGGSNVLLVCFNNQIVRPNRSDKNEGWCETLTSRDRSRTS